MIVFIVSATSVADSSVYACNQRDFEGVRQRLVFIWQERVDEAIAAALEAGQGVAAV